MKKILPIGKQDFAGLIQSNCVYVDKTKLIHKLISEGFYYFFSRPRRFGKSLTVSTLKEIFSGNKEIFKGLWIYNQIDWKQYSVIHIDFSKIGTNELGIERAIVNELDHIAASNDIKLANTTPGLKLRELIHHLSKKAQVVILIDEYDKPIIDYIDDIPKAEENRKILKDFYSVLKGNDAHIKFLFITGVSKFSQVSIFSDLNNLEDITIDENYATLVGYTEEELHCYFADYIQTVSEKYKNIYPDIMAAIKEWYNGYSWDGQNFVYNPFSMLNFFKKSTFYDYWFRTGTPTFLTKMLKAKNYSAFDLENRKVPISIFDKYEITNISLLPLLFQTGYLTIKSMDIQDGTVLLNYPNREVANSFSIHLLSELNNTQADTNGTILIDMTAALRNNSIEKFIELSNILFKNIAYAIADETEKYFHSVFYLIVRMLGFTIEAEVLTIDGRIDAVISTKEYIYIIEFKVGQSAPRALQQIKEKEYHKKYADDKRKKILVGINFNTEKKKIEDYVCEAV